MKILMTSLVAVSAAMFSIASWSSGNSNSQYGNGVPFHKKPKAFNYQDYASTALTKVFAASGSAVNGTIIGNLSFDTEVRNYDYLIPGQISYTRDRKLGGTSGLSVNYSVVTLDSSGDELLLTKFERFDNAGIVLRETRTMTPGVIFRTDRMKIGKTFGSYSSLDSSTKGPSNVIQAVTLLGVEDVVVPAGSFSDCLKIFRHRNAERLGGEYDRINWVCPNGVGLAKQVTMTNTQTATVLELTSMTP